MRANENPSHTSIRFRVAIDEILAGSLQSFCLISSRMDKATAADELVDGDAVRAWMPKPAAGSPSCEAAGWFPNFVGRVPSVARLAWELNPLRTHWAEKSGSSQLVDLVQQLRNRACCWKMLEFVP